MADFEPHVQPAGVSGLRIADYLQHMLYSRCLRCALILQGKFYRAASCSMLHGIAACKSIHRHSAMYKQVCS